MVDLNEAPFQEMYGPCQVWLNSSPDVVAPPLGAVVSGGTWLELGTSVLDDMPDAGLTVAFAQSHQVWRGIGRTRPSKARRDTQDVRVSFGLADMTPETMGYVFDSAGIALVTTTAAAATTVGYKSVLLTMSPNMQRGTLVVRFNQSPYGLSSANTPIWRSQLHLVNVVQVGQVSAQFRKAGEPAVVAFEFEALADYSTTRKDSWQAVHAGQTMP